MLYHLYQFTHLIRIHSKKCVLSIACNLSENSALLVTATGVLVDWVGDHVSCTSVGHLASCLGISGCLEDSLGGKDCGFVFEPLEVGWLFKHGFLLDLPLLQRLPDHLAAVYFSRLSCFLRLLSSEQVLFEDNHSL